MKSFVNNWATISLILAVIVALIINFASFNFTQNILLALIVCLLLHFYEEFGFPGGFPYVGMKVLMNSKEKNPARWGANNLNSLFGNWGFLFLVYVLPLMIPSIRFLTLAAILFSFLEFFMHAILFNRKLKTFYNPDADCNLLFDKHLRTKFVRLARLYYCVRLVHCSFYVLFQVSDLLEARQKSRLSFYKKSCLWI